MPVSPIVANHNSCLKHSAAIRPIWGKLCRLRAIVQTFVFNACILNLTQLAISWTPTKGLEYGTVYKSFLQTQKKTIRTKGIKTFSPDVGSAPSISQELVSSHPSDFSISCPLLPGIFCSDIPLLLLFLLLLSKLSCSLLSHQRAILCGIAASLADFPFSFCGKVFSLAWNLFCASLV